jgi:hypothetical protein
MTSKDYKTYGEYVQVEIDSYEKLLLKYIKMNGNLFYIR